MAKRTTFGQTWWGEQWLNALSNTDNSNRLPRGRTYANNGSVKDFKIENNAIHAKVQGSQRLPYKQQLGLVSFTQGEKDIIIESIRWDMGILAALLNREMPQTLNDLLKSKNIHLFPKDWRSLSMKCSCPDYAVPCKHLAAVVYLIANEIDRNPFALFELRGFDLLGELQKKGILSATEKSQQNIATLSDFVLPSDTEIYNGTISPETFYNLALTQSFDGKNRLLQLLDDATLFYQGSFKEILQKIYKQTAKHCSKEYIFEKDTMLHKTILAANDVSIDLDENGYWSNLNLNKNSHLRKTWVNESEEKLPPFLFDNSNKKNTKKSTLTKFMQLLESTDFEQLWAYSNQWIALYSIYRFAQNLALTSNFMPRLLETADGHRIQWIPADINPEVKKQLDALINFCPNDLLFWTNKKDKSSYFTPKEQIRAICDLFVGEWVEAASSDLLQDRITGNYKILHCFIKRSALPFNGLSEKEMPASIQLWLQKFYLQHKRFVPMLCIEEAKHGFFVKVQMEDRLHTDTLPIDWQDFISHKDYFQQRMSAIQDISMLTKYLPILSGLLKSPPQYLIHVSEEAFEKIFFDVLPVMELLGITILLPKSLRKILFPQLSMSISKNTNEVGKSFMVLSDMLDFDWRIAIGDRLLTPEEFRELVAQKSGLVKIHNEYVHLDKDQLQKLLKQLENQPKIRPQDLMQAALAENYKGAAVLIDKKVQDALESMRQVKEIPLPKGLMANLRPYQLNGFSWLYKNAQLGMGSILADDMGLGKTLQVITLLLKFKEDGLLEKQKALIVVPTSLLTNWEKEVKKFAPNLNIAVYHGTKRSIPEHFDLLATSYGVLRSDENILKKHKWYVLAIDEAQAIKNVTTVQTKAVKSLKANIFVAMSGTPVENRLSEYWSIMDFTNKGYLGNLNKFTEEFAKPIQQEHDLERMETFKKITSPFILRRLKSDKSIIKDLPDKITKDHFVKLEKEQIAVYENLVKNTLKEIEKAEGIARKGLVLTLMSGLKQICNHPAQYLKKGDKDPELSGKAKAVLELLDIIQAEQEKVLIFTQYTETGKLLVEWAKERYGREPLFLHGGNSRQQRDAMVDAFQNNRQDNIFILSLKAGGTGLNLTAANHVIHYDLWWNPAVENQATDRAYRIGQQKNVLVYRMICEGTLEEKIDKMLVDKKGLADMTVNIGETWLGDLGDAELKELVELGG